MKSLLVPPSDVNGNYFNVRGNRLSWEYWQNSDISVIAHIVYMHVRVILKREIM